MNKMKIYYLTIQKSQNETFFGGNNDLRQVLNKFNKLKEMNSSKRVDTTDWDDYAEAWKSVLRYHIKEIEFVDEHKFMITRTLATTFYYWI